MSNTKSYHMSTDDFRRHGKEMIDWIADYYETVESYPVLARARPGEVAASLGDELPVHGEGFSKILRDATEKILPGLTHWQSPGFHAYFPANTSGPAILGELLSAGLGVQGMLWSTSPACTEVETRVLDLLAELLGLPESYRSTGNGGGVIQDSASSAVLCALIAARERDSGQRSNRVGCDGTQVAYCSTQTHSSLEKAMGVAGLGRANLRQIEVDERFALDAERLAVQIRSDRAAGLRPIFVCATLGTTSSNAVDPIADIGRICSEEGLWFHVDAAMSGTAAICPEYRHLNDGVEYADSYCFNPHKWMFTNFDCSCFWVADRAALVGALSILPEYLANEATRSGAVFDYRDWQIPLGRRFRALKLWFVLRYYGVEGLRYHIRRHIELTGKLVAWIEADPHFEIVAPAPFNLVCFRYRGSDGLNQRIMEELNEGGEIFLTHTRLNGRFVLRLCVGQARTELEHVEKAWNLVAATAERLRRIVPLTEIDQLS
ncbi:MAG: pyridoxal-dependent decarboxylase [Gammaproteobacteria bacterium]|nr:pyridoxal-dependent decarboxylase [Gammaproteobacteria bacterium]